VVVPAAFRAPGPRPWSPKRGLSHAHTVRSQWSSDRPTSKRSDALAVSAAGVAPHIWATCGAWTRIANGRGQSASGPSFAIRQTDSPQLRRDDARTLSGVCHLQTTMLSGRERIYGPPRAAWSLAHLVHLSLKYTNTLGLRSNLRRLAHRRVVPPCGSACPSPRSVSTASQYKQTHTHPCTHPSTPLRWCSNRPHQGTEMTDTKRPITGIFRPGLTVPKGGSAPFVIRPVIMQT